MMEQQVLKAFKGLLELMEQPVLKVRKEFREPQVQLVWMEQTVLMEQMELTEQPARKVLKEFRA